MILYNCLAISPLILGLLFDQYRYNRGLKRDDSQKMMLIFFGVLLFLMIALRHNSVGSTDSHNYYNNWQMVAGYKFSNLGGLFEESEMEGGYLISVWLLSRIFKSPQFVFVFSGILFSFSVCRFIYKNSENKVLSAIMFVTVGGYTFMVQGLRQAVAMSILLFSVEYCKKRKLIPFLLLVVLASLFHVTAIVFVVVYFLYGFKLDTKTMIIVSVVSLVILLTAKFWVNIGNKLLEENYGSTAQSGGFIEAAVYIIIVVAALLFAGEKSKEKEFAFFFYMTFAGMIIYFMRYFGTQAAERVSFYFVFARSITLPSVISRFDKRSQFLLNLIVGTLCVLLAAYRLSGSDLVPYKFFWQ